jgi:hypothetical protein
LSDLWGLADLLSAGYESCEAHEVLRDSYLVGLDGQPVVEADCVDEMIEMRWIEQERGWR